MNFCRYGKDFLRGVSLADPGPPAALSPNLVANKVEARQDCLNP
jgi:hypothetical protein